jgi:hypothetical protein
MIHLPKLCVAEMCPTFSPEASSSHTRTRQGVIVSGPQPRLPWRMHPESWCLLWFRSTRIFVLGGRLTRSSVDVSFEYPSQRRVDRVCERLSERARLEPTTIMGPFTLWQRATVTHITLEDIGGHLPRDDVYHLHSVGPRHHPSQLALLLLSFVMHVCLLTRKASFRRAKYSRSGPARPWSRCTTPRRHTGICPQWTQC